MARRREFTDPDLASRDEARRETLGLCVAALMEYFWDEDGDIADMEEYRNKAEGVFMVNSDEYDRPL